MTQNEEKTDYNFGSHVLHCRERSVTLHVTGETPEIVEERWKIGSDLLAAYVKTGKLPAATPQGIVLKVSDLVNHGSGGP